MSTSFYLPESLSDHDALAGDPPSVPADPGTDQFKTVRGWFDSRDAVEQAVAEQAEFGWALYEVVDKFRLRFRRTAQAAAKDVARVGNPYATTCRNRSANPVAFLLILGPPLLVALVFIVVSVCWFTVSPAPTQPATVSVQAGGKRVAIEVPEVPAVPVLPVPPEAPRVIVTRGR